MSEERFDRIEQRLERLEVGQDGLKADVHGLNGEVGGLKAEMREMKADLKHEMRILHEDVIDRIKAIQTDAPSRTEFREGLADIREAFAQRLDPLEAAVRHLIKNR